jgi:hypothetical protein
LRCIHSTAQHSSVASRLLPPCSALWYGAGIQACWRGYRLYDVPATQSVVKYWSSWFQAHRAILTSDIIHIRRSDMQVRD